MLGDLIAATVGRNIDRRDGEGGALGAALGVVTWRVAKRAVPAAVVIGGVALGALYLKRKLSGEPSAPA